MKLLNETGVKPHFEDSVLDIFTSPGKGYVSKAAIHRKTMLLALVRKLYLYSLN